MCELKPNNAMNHSTKSMKSTLYALTLFLCGLVFVLPKQANAQTSGDLAIAIYNTPLDVYTNDYMPYTMLVSNLGPGTISSVVVSNTLPSGFSVVDSSATYTLVNNTLVFNLGSMTNLAKQKIVVRAQPASAGSYAISASVSAPNNADPNNANNSSSFNVSVGNYLGGNLVASLISTNFIDPQTGLTEQWLQLSNSGPNSVSSARVIVAGPTNSLYDAAGTNNGNPFIIYGSTLNAGQSANLLLEYAPRTTSQFSFSILQPFATSLANLAPPPSAILGTPSSPSLVVRISIGAIVESPSSTNANYSIVYSSSPSFSDPAIMFPMSFHSGANQILFADYGPPISLSSSTNTPRYYRIYLNP
jgi:uncharacterized repeat protein (TIGR01451 family)